MFTKIKHSGYFLISALITLPTVSFAQGINYTLTSPLINITSISDLLVAILRIFITVATPIVVLFIILAGFKYVTARGNAQQVQEATQAITYAIIGGLLILGAVAISGIITNVVNSIAS